MRRPPGLRIQKSLNTYSSFAGWAGNAHPPLPITCRGQRHKKTFSKAGRGRIAGKRFRLYTGFPLRTPSPFIRWLKQRSKIKSDMRRSMI